MKLNLIEKSYWNNRTTSVLSVVQNFYQRMRFWITVTTQVMYGQLSTGFAILRKVRYLSGSKGCVVRIEEKYWRGYNGTGMTSIRINPSILHITVKREGGVENDS